MYVPVTHTQALLLADNHSTSLVSKQNSGDNNDAVIFTRKWTMPSHNIGTVLGSQFQFRIKSLTMQFSALLCQGSPMAKKKKNQRSPLQGWQTERKIQALFLFSSLLLPYIHVHLFVSPEPTSICPAPFLSLGLIFWALTHHLPQIHSLSWILDVNGVLC